MNGLLHFLTEIQRAGLKIHTVYDIGAFTGEWSKAVKSTVLKEADFVLFEANPAYAATLAATGFKHFITVLSNPERKEVEFYNGTNTGDSYYKENTKFYDNQGSIKLNCTTLNALVEKHNLPIPNFIKIDTQGSELDILSGAESFLNQVDLIYTECPIIRYNTGAPNIQEYLDYFRNHKFIPISLLETHYGENTLLQVDIMFMRQESKERLLGPNVNIRPWAP